MPRMVPTMLLAAVPLILLAGCQTTGTAATDTAVCAQWRGIQWSRADTAETVDGIKGNNARRRAWCG